MSGILNLLLGSAAGVIKDAYFNLVTLLLNTTATNGAQNNTFLDSSTNNFSITRNGNTTQGTFTPFSQTGWSNYFGTYANAYGLYCNPGSAVAFGTGDFTVECWAYMATAPLAGGDNPYILDTRNGGGAWAFSWNWTGTSTPTTLFWTKADNTYFNSSVTMQYNTWNHCAYVRSSGVGTIYLNGVAVGTATDTSNYPSISQLEIGVRYAYNVGMPGYLSNLRILKGTALYTSNFTPPTTALTAIANTSLLTCQSNRFVDNSTNNFTISIANGTPSVQAFSPFAPTTAYSTSLVGGSGYFDGSGDYLTTSSNAAFAFGLSDFEVDFWIYATALPASDNNILNQNLSSGTPQFYIDSTGKLQYRNAFIGAVLTSNTTFKTGQWYYCVISRVSLTTRMFINGVLDTSGADANNWSNTAGWYISNNSGSFTGYISNVRLVNGSGITSSTVPTAPLTAITNTVLLTNFTNAGIYDAAAKNNAETVGNAQVSTTTAQFGTTSMYFDGTGDCLIFPPTTNFLFGGDFTIEGWFNRDNGVDNSIFVMETSGANYFALNVASTGYSVYLNATGPNFSPSVTLSNNTWYHVALVRSGSTVTLYHNGTSVGSTTNSSVLGSASVISYVGGINGGLKAYIDDLRITKYARYTANFSVPTTAFPLQ